MKYVLIFVLVALCIVTMSQMTMAAEATTAWFTNASIVNSIVGTATDTLPSATGTVSNGVSLTKSVGISATTLYQQHGMISFWIKPNWNGNDGVRHKFAQVGDPTSNGLIIEKTAANTLRFLMTASGKSTACRADVSSWQASKWHHIVCSWIDKNGKALGLCLWIDKVCVSSMPFAGSAFMNPATMSDSRVYIGDTSSDATMDELLIRNADTGTYGPGQLDMVYRDYFRTAPITSIQIDDQPYFVNADTRVVKGQMKQFGLKGLLDGQWVKMTDYAVRYGNWGDFDAKPFINWTSSSTTVATVDNSSSSFNRGRVTGKAVGHTTLTATFGSLSATRDVEVFDSTNKPDLDLMFVERLPRYSSKADQKWPNEGDTVQSVAHIANFGIGTGTVPAGTVVKFEIIPDTNGNFVCDPEETPTSTQTTTIGQLAPTAMTTVTFNWTWTMNPVFIRVTVDPSNTVSEICEANNQRCELNIARAFLWGWVPSQFNNDYNGKHLNLVGSFSDYDWCDAETDRMALVMRNAVCPTTSTVGIRDSIRVDNFIQRLYYGDDSMYNQEPYVIAQPYYDGWFGNMEPQNSTIMDIDAAIGHEIGHTTIWLPDVYGYPHQLYNMFLKDDNGQPYAGTQMYPAIDGGTLAPFTSAYTNYPDSLGVGYSALMIFCHLWLDDFCAGLSDWQRQTRSGLPWDDPGILIPKENALKILDINDQPLTGAAVYVTPIILNTGISSEDAKYVPNRYKYIGNTDSNGIYAFPDHSDVDWDDPDSDVADGSVYYWNPFTHLTSNAYCPNLYNGECLVLRIVSGTQTEFQWLPLTEANRAYMAGNTDGATYTIRTSLTSAPGGTQIVRQTIPDAIRTQNLVPVAVAPTLVTVKPGQAFTLDASGSYDPEGQPLNYRWILPTPSNNATYSDIASSTEGDYTYQFYVNDGLRNSSIATITVRVRANSSIGGKVTDSLGNPVANAIVGVKTTHYATADAAQYFLTDANGNYGPTYFAPGTYYVSVWKDGYAPSADVTATVVYNTPLTKNLQLGNVQDANIALGLQTVAASNSDGGAPTLATDGNFDTTWDTMWWPAEPVYYYMDLQAPAEITDITLYRYLEIAEETDSSDMYTIDVMTSGTPLDPASWVGNPNVSNVYPLTAQTRHGYPIQSDLAVDPIGLHLTNIRGIRISMQHLCWPPDYRMAEFQVHAKYAPIQGRVIDSQGSPVVGAIVGFKSSAKATADTESYAITDSQGHYSLTSKHFDTCYVAAWKDGFCPSNDTTVTATNGATVPDIVLAPAGPNLILRTTKVGASQSSGSYTATKAVDASLTTYWRTNTSPSGSQYYYIDLGAKTDIADLVTYRYLERNTSGDSRDDIQIDVMTSATANPLTSSNWNNSANGVSTVYNATDTIHGYEIQSGIAVDPIKLSLTGVRGIRIKFNNYHSQHYYDLKEVQVHQTATYQQVGEIADLKNLANGSYVSITGKTLTALPGLGIPTNVGYIEETDQSSGIRLDLSSLLGWTATVGNTVNARGVMGLTTDKEKYILVNSWDYSAGQAVNPLIFTTKTLGGAPFYGQDGPWVMLNSTLTQESGLNNIGLLVKVCGTVTQIDTAGTYFYIDDGSGTLDGTTTGTDSNVGVRIAGDGRSYTVGTFTTIVGVSSCFLHTDGYIRSIVRPISIQ